MRQLERDPAPHTKKLAQQKTDFTAEGAPPPGLVASTPPLTLDAASERDHAADAKHKGHTMTSSTSRPNKSSAISQQGPMVLDKAGLLAAAQDLDHGAITPHYGPWREDIIKLLNDALATELVCVLRYKRHHFTAEGLASSKIADEFLVHANEEALHADRLARRIVQLGGDPDFSPESLTRRSHAPYDASRDLMAMIKSNLLAERVAIEGYSQMIDLIGEKDATTRRLLEDILAEEQAHAEELRDWLAH